MQLPILSILIFLPIVGIGILLILDRKHHKGLKVATLVISVVEFLVSLPLWFNFDSQTAAMQFVERRDGCRPTASATTWGSTASPCCSSCSPPS